MAERQATANALPEPAARRSRLVTASRGVAALVLVLLALVPVWATVMKEPFYITLFTRILIFALAAVGLNLILGYGGMVSFGHAMYIGVGAYAVGLLSHHGIHNGWLHLASALVVGAMLALAVGAICLRTSGMAFIMITLAFAQMLFFLAISLKEYGGDDGMPIAKRSDFGWFTLDQPITLYYVAFVLLLLMLGLCARLLNARFGMVLQGAKGNDRRMAALGFPVFRYRLAAYVISALVCVVAGVLMANLTKFVAPSYMAWSVSGELIVMTVLGGLGTLLGPVVGAAVLLLLEELLSSFKLGWGTVDALIQQHWLGLIGIFIVAIVLLMKQGLYGWFVARDRRAKDAP